MIALRNKDTSTYHSGEVKARRNFLIFYAFFVTIFMSLVGFYYYKYREGMMFEQERAMMTDYGIEQARKLKLLHKNYPNDDIYPRSKKYKSAIYDLEYKKIFSLIDDENIMLDELLYRQDDSIYFVKILDEYYLGAKYLVLETPQDNKWLINTANKMILFGLMALVLLAVLGEYLAVIFVRPMKESMQLLDRFMNDTAHELNTPLSSILANIEMIDESGISKDNAKYFQRIKLGAKSVSVLYEDLKFLTLEKHNRAEDEELDLTKLARERISYFSVMIESRQITLNADLNHSTIRANRRIISILLDNLISNAIKYNNRGGEIGISLFEGKLMIEDSGIGMTKEQMSGIFQRYTRYNEVEGGFGIGLSIVKMIADSYDVKIKVTSNINKGTKVELKW